MQASASRMCLESGLKQTYTLDFITASMTPLIWSMLVSENGQPYSSRTTFWRSLTISMSPGKVSTSSWPQIFFKFQQYWLRLSGRRTRSNSSGRANTRSKKQQAAVLARRQWHPQTSSTLSLHFLWFCQQNYHWMIGFDNMFTFSQPPSASNRSLHALDRTFFSAFSHVTITVRAFAANLPTPWWICHPWEIR